MCQTIRSSLRPGERARAQSLGGTRPVTSGASLTVDEGGVLQGRIQLTDGDDTLQIAGRFLASGTSLFGDGEDVLVNTGSVFVTDGAAAFDGLERFENQGLFSLANGDAGDSLDLSDIAFMGGEGSVLAFDVLSDAPVASWPMTSPSGWFRARPKWRSRPRPG